MTQAELAQFLGWFTLVNYSCLLFSFLMLSIFRSGVLSIHAATTGVAKEELPRLYFQFYSLYKILIMTFGLVPWIVLKFLM